MDAGKTLDNAALGDGETLEGQVEIVNNDNVLFSYVDGRNELMCGEMPIGEYRAFGLRGYHGEGFYVKVLAGENEVLKFFPKPDAEERHKQYLDEEAERNAHMPTDWSDTEQVDAYMRLLQEKLGD